MTVLVTGATGDLGQRVLDRLLGDGTPVRVLTRRPFHPTHAPRPGLTVHEWHPLSEPVPAAAMDGVAAVIHLAGAPLGGPATARRLAAIATSRRIATERLAAALPPGARLVVASVASATCAGTNAPDEVLTEASPRRAPAPGFDADVVAWEAAAQAAKARGVSVALVRLGLLLAPGAFWRGVADLARLGIRTRHAGRQIPCIHPDDAAALLTGLLARPDLEGPINGVAVLPLRGEDLDTMLASLARVPLRLPVPRHLLRQRLGPLASLLETRARIVPHRLVEAGAAFAHPDPRQATAHLLAEIGRMRDGAGLNPGAHSLVQPPALASVPMGQETPVPPRPQ